MTWPMIALGFALAIVQRGRAGYARLQEIFDAKPEVVDGPLPAPRARRRRRSRVDGPRRFAYGERKVLDDVSFEVRAGRVARHRRAHRLGQDDARDAPRAPPAHARRARCASTAYDVCDLPLVVGARGRSATRSRTRSSSRRPCRATSASRSTTADSRRGAWRRSATPRARRRCSRRRSGCPSSSTPSSASAACSSRAGRSSASRSRARSCGSRRSSSSTTRSPPSTRRRSRRSSTRSSARPRSARSSSSPTASPRRRAATRIVVLDEGTDRRAGHARRARAERRALRRVRRGAADGERARATLEPIAGDAGRPAPMSARPTATKRARAPRSPAPRRAEAEKLRAFHEEDAHRQGVRRAPRCARLWPFVQPHAQLRRRLARDARRRWRAIEPASARSSWATSCARRDGGDAPTRSCATASASRVLLVVVQSLTFAQMYTMQIAGARAMADLRAHIFRFFQRLRAPLLRPHAGRAPRDARDERRRRRRRALRVGRAQRDGRPHLAQRASSSMMLVARLAAVAHRVRRAAARRARSSTSCASARARPTATSARKTARLNAFLNEQVNGIAVVQAFARERAMAARVRRDQRRLPRRQQALHLLRGASSTRRSRWSSTLCIASILWCGGLHAHRATTRSRSRSSSPSRSTSSSSSSR